MPSLHDEFLLDPEVVFLNHGSQGATPRIVFDSYQRWQRELERQPIAFGRTLGPALQIARDALAEYLVTQADNLVYILNATLGMNIVAHNLNLKAGDEVLATDHEYGAVDNTWRFLAHQKGFNYINHSMPVPFTTHAEFIERFWQGVTPRTKVISISHITSPTALIFPIKEICTRAREVGIITVIDGAHAPGQIPLALDDIGADFYTGNLHKWLCAPKGSAFLFARPEMQHLLNPFIVSWAWHHNGDSKSHFVDYHQWQGTRDHSAFLASVDAIKFQKTHHWNRVRAECHALLSETQQRIAEVTELPLLFTNDESWCAQMGTAQLPPVDLEALRAYLVERHNIEIPLFTWNNHYIVRISIQGYNTQSDADKLVDGIKSFLAK